MLTRILAAIATLLATTVGELGAGEAEAAVEPPRVVAKVKPVARDAREVVFSFGDALDELHNAIAYDAESRDAKRVRSACRPVLRQYPALRDAVEERATALLIAAESMVDACRRGHATHLDDHGFEIVDGDYYTFRELSFDVTS